MRARSRGSAILVALVALLGQAAPARLEPPYLERPEGPYRGRVVDSITGEPIEGAGVLVYWQNEDPRYEGQEDLLAARETLTDARGEFLVDASAVERDLPPRTFPPRILIYKPGYATYPRAFSRPPGAPARLFAGASREVLLGALRDDEDRAEAANNVIATISAIRANARQLPAFVELLRQALEQAGVPGGNPAGPLPPEQ